MLIGNTILVMIEGWLHRACTFVHINCLRKDPDWVQNGLLNLFKANRIFLIEQRALM